MTEQLNRALARRSGGSLIPHEAKIALTELAPALKEC